MANQPDYRAQAAKCRAEAEAATLDNVREQRLRAEAAWLDMALRQEQVARSRIAREAASPAVQTITQETT
ncbi:MULTISPECIES: hypothetical protein [Sphingomonas]|uniref:Uncharacterized protein n=1 Tax=Sphingomonas kyeonggiensis TaxID=1268553 RepID=A0A7W7K4M7_9SPHN|nr:MULTISPECIES: hypothetical protein [Sphingomonas]MBB4840627.1 hypothetical protein [Sphingomonas kyeonggiensis]WHU00933.1 hypothetical protein O3305_11945 [Sphingomonas sp. NIBR02145]